jgi:hypothetical protein
MNVDTTNIANVDTTNIADFAITLAAVCPCEKERVVVLQIRDLRRRIPEAEAAWRRWQVGYENANRAGVFGTDIARTPEQRRELHSYEDAGNDLMECAEDLKDEYEEAIQTLGTLYADRLLGPATFSEPPETER